MGSPTFYWYPSGSSTLEKTTLPRLTRLEPADVVDVEDGYSGNLGLVRTYRGTRRRIRITLERTSMLTSAGQVTHRSMQALIEHLRGGGAVGFSQDHDKSWAVYASSTWARANAFINSYSTSFTSWSSAIPTAGQDVVIESPPIYAQSEQHLITSFDGVSRINLSDTLTFDYKDYGPAMARWYRFWPALRLPGDTLRPPITNEHGIAWTLDLTLEVDSAIFWAAGDQYAQRALAFGIGDTTARAPGVRASLDTILKAVRQGVRP